MSIDLFDPPAPTMPARETARRRTHLLREIERTPAQRSREGRGGGRSALLGRNVLLAGAGRKAALAVALAALIAVLAAVLPGRLGRSQMTLVDQAIAAIGNGPTIHVALDEGRHAQLVDLRTDRTTLLRSQVDVWSDSKLGTLWISTLDGTRTQTFVLPASQQRSARDEWWRLFVGGYRAQLRSGAYHVAGSGQIAGQPVSWIASKPITNQDGGREVTEIAISRTTYKPLYIRERIDGVIARGTGVRVLTAETLPRQTALFARHVTEVGPGLTGTPIGSGGTRTTLRAARAAMNPDPLVPAARIARLRRTWVGLPDYLIPPYNSYRDQVGGVTLYYGRLDYAGYPTYHGSYISITEIPNRKAIVALWGTGLFRQDAAIIIDNTTATMKTHGLYVLIHASSRAQALAAARTLAH